MNTLHQHRQAPVHSVTPPMHSFTRGTYQMHWCMPVHQAVNCAWRDHVTTHFHHDVHVNAVVTDD